MATAFRPRASAREVVLTGVTSTIVLRPAELDADDEGRALALLERMGCGALVERRFGRLRLFLNAENLTNVRQTRWDPLVRPAQGADGRWTVDGWAPLDGRVLNGGLRLEF